VQSTQLVCVDDPSQICDIELDRIEDPTDLVSNRQVQCTSETCANPCPGTGKLCRPRLVKNSAGNLIELHGTMTVTSMEEELGEGRRNLDVTASAVFLATNNPLPADLVIAPQRFARSFRPQGSCTGNQDAPGVIVRDEDAIVDALAENDVVPGGTPLIGWFPLQSNACVLDSMCSGETGFDFDGMIIPFGAARTALSQAAKTAFPLQTLNIDPVPLMVDVTRTSGKGGGIVSVRSACVEPTAIGPAESTRTNQYAVTVRFALPRGTANRLLCDANRDGSVGRVDIDGILAAVGKTVPSGDLRDANGDGIVNVYDARTCSLMCDTASCGLVAAETLLAGGSTSAAISGDVLVLGNYTTDQVRVYRRDAGSWEHEATLTGPQFSSFGRSVDVDRETLVVGADRESLAYVYEFDPDVTCIPTQATCWELRGTLQSAFPRSMDDLFGWSVSIDGDTILIGAPNHTPDSHLPGAGAAFVFKQFQGNWPSLATFDIEPHLPTSDDFGWSVAVDRTFRFIGRPEGFPLYVIGAPKTDVGFGVNSATLGSVLITDDDRWFNVTAGGAASDNVQPTSVPASKLGYSVGVDSDGTLVIGTAGRQAFVFEQSPQPFTLTWTEAQVVSTSASPIDSLSISGGRFAVGTQSSPIDIFAFRSGSWVRDLVLQPGGGTGTARFGGIVGLEQDRLASSGSGESFVIELTD
jgi:hypothetical protein